MDKKNEKKIETQPITHVEVPTDEQLVGVTESLHILEQSIDSRFKDIEAKLETVTKQLERVLGILERLPKA